MDAADTRASPEKEEVICMRSITAQRLAEFTEQDYEFTFGITRKEFAQMLEALNAAYCKEHRRRPHFTKITMQDKLVLTCSTAASTAAWRTLRQNTVSPAIPLRTISTGWSAHC